MQQPPIVISGPLSFGEIIARSIRLYRAYFWTLVLTAAIPLTPVLIIKLIIIAAEFRPRRFYRFDNTGSTLENIWDLYVYASSEYYIPPLALLQTVVSIVVYAALAYHCIAALRQHRSGVAENVRNGLRRFEPFLWNRVIFHVLGLSMLFTSLILSKAPYVGPGVPFLLLIAFIYLSGRWIIALPLIVAEMCGPSQALGRSWKYTRDVVWRSLAFLLLSALAELIMLHLPIFTLTAMLDLGVYAGQEAFTYRAVSAARTVISMIAYPLNAALLVVCYFDLRARQEVQELTVRINQVKEGLGADPSI
jgi:membrane-anchored glycerophosphoryl diester phosphodiesterase (GDPDase)